MQPVKQEQINNALANTFLCVNYNCKILPEKCAKRQSATKTIQSSVLSGKFDFSTLFMGCVNCKQGEKVAKKHNLSVSARRIQLYKKKEKKEKVFTKTCACGTVFATTRKNQRFCPKHSAMHPYTRAKDLGMSTPKDGKDYKRKNKFKTECLECGKSFVKRHNNNKYCGQGCYREAKRRKEREGYLKRKENA